MLNLYDKSVQKIAVLENAYDQKESMDINSVGQFTFTLPATDGKIGKCAPYLYVRNGDNGPLFRILNPCKNDDGIGIKTFPCEHVIATLSDDLMFQEHHVGGAGIPTEQIIQYILDQQTTRFFDLLG